MMETKEVTINVPSNFNDNQIIKAFNPSKDGIIQNGKAVSYDELFINNYSNQTTHKENYIPYLLLSIMDMLSFFEAMQIQEDASKIKSLIFNSIKEEKEQQRKKSTKELTEISSDYEKLLDFSMNNTLKLNYNDRWTYNLTKVLYTPLMKKENLCDSSIFYIFKQSYLHKDEFFKLMIQLIPQLYAYVITNMITLPIQIEEFSAYPNTVSNLNAYAKLKSFEFYSHLSDMIRENQTIQNKCRIDANKFSMFGIETDTELLFPFTRSYSLEKNIRNQINDIIDACFGENDLGRELILCEGHESVFEEYINSKSTLREDLTEQEMCKVSFFLNCMEKMVDFTDSSLDYALSMTSSMKELIDESVLQTTLTELSSLDTLGTVQVLLNENKQLKESVSEMKKNLTITQKEKREVSSKVKNLKMSTKILEDKLKEKSNKDNEAENREKELLQKIEELEHQLKTKEAELDKLSIRYKELNANIFSKNLTFDEM